MFFGRSTGQVRTGSALVVENTSGRMIKRQALCKGTRRHLADCEPSELKDTCPDVKDEIWVARRRRLEADYRTIVEISKLRSITLRLSEAKRRGRYQQIFTERLHVCKILWQIFQRGEHYILLGKCNYCAIVPYLKRADLPS